MTTLVPRPAYTLEELQRLYPRQLKLEQVQIILRHGERTPVGARFQTAGLAPYWPYCHVANRFKDVLMASKDGSSWDTLTYKRQLETLGPHNTPVLAKGKRGEVDAICQPGELTDKGRETTLALGQRIRHLYVSQLSFLPDILTDPSTTVALRSTPIPRALESVQQAFQGLYPPSSRTATCPSPTIVARAMNEETLFPNTGACKRFGELFDLFADRAAQRWNDSSDMDYLNKKLGKWMPEASRRIAVDGKPRLSGIMDTTNATLAHGPDTRLPGEFYDPKVLSTIDKIACDEWYSGFHENREYRMLGMGGLASDLTTRMVRRAEMLDRQRQRGEPVTIPPAEDGDQTRAKLWMAGAHDTTLAGLLASLGAFGNNKWPPFTSHIAFELFSRNDIAQPVVSNSIREQPSTTTARSWWSSLPFFGSSSTSTEPATAATKPTSTLSPAERTLLQTHYVRVRYNDTPAIIPGCRLPGKHLDGDESFCTLEAFKEIVEEFAPKDWKRQCREGLGRKEIPSIEKAGFAVGQSKSGAGVLSAESTS